MMSCFETRQEFVRFWRGALDGERRQMLLSHLKGCPKCDRAFRAFALTAPMLHARGEAAAARAGATPHSAPQNPGWPMNMNGGQRTDAQRAAEILHRASVYRIAQRRPIHQWREAAAALSAVAAAVLMIYFSLAAPPPSLDDMLGTTDSVSETVPQTGTDLLGQQQIPSQTGTDFLGQQIPSMPAVGSDLAG
jgi:anti-sigma factor RsiW